MTEFICVILHENMDFNIKINLVSRYLIKNISKHMKQFILSIGFLFILTCGLNAQIQLIGAANGYRPGKIDIVEWQIFDSATVQVFPSELNAYLVATSGYDAYNGKYYLSGISDINSETGLLEFDANNNTQSFKPGTLVSNISEFDMATGTMYKLTMDAQKNINVYATSLSTNQDSVIGSIQEPDALGLVLDAITFDANAGIIYYVGMNTDNSMSLYKFSVRNPPFLVSKIQLTTSYYISTITAVNYDNVRDRLFARIANFDSTNKYLGTDIIEIEKNSGFIFLKVSLNKYPYFLASSSSYDQLSGTYVLVGLDSLGKKEMIAVNTNTDTYISGYVPNSVSEIICNNTTFANSKYGAPTGISKLKQDEFKIYPNPVTDRLYIDTKTNEAFEVEVYSVSGEKILSKKIEVGESRELDLRGNSKGIYLIQISSKEKMSTKKISLN